MVQHIPLNQPLLSVKNLGRKLSERWLWRSVNFDLFEHDRLGLVGPSGIGKTLLMRNLVLLDPVQQGQVLFDGKTSATWSLPIYRTKVMYLSQRATVFEGTVQDNLQQVFELAVYRHRRFDCAQIIDWLDQLGRRSDFLRLQAPQLSGGETQILALLRVLQLAPQVLLLDEPTASLDPDTTTRVESLITNWLRQPHRACLLTSHDREQIRRITNRQLRLEEFG